MIVKHDLETQKYVTDYLAQQRWIAVRKKLNSFSWDVVTVMFATSIIAAGSLAIYYSDQWVPQLKAYMHLNGIYF